MVRRSYSRAPYKRKRVTAFRRKSRYARARGIRSVRGRGSYWSDLGRTVLSSGGMAAGGALGTIYGSPWMAGPGAALGGTVGNAIADISGFGGYKVRANSMLDEGVKVPAFGNMQHATRIRHREYITDIVGSGSTAFSIQSFPINPGMVLSFPWLSQIAASYQEYQVMGMVYEFVSTTSDTSSASGSQALGTIILATDYNSADANFSNKIAMENSQYCVSDRPSKSLIHAIECDPSSTNNPVKFVRDTTVPSGKDIRLYDQGNFQVAFQGVTTTAGSVLGELWVSYDIALYKPILNPGIGSLMDHFQISTSVSSSHYLSADTTTVNSPTYGTIGGTTKNSTYFFPPQVNSGGFLFVYQVTGASTALNSGLLNTLTNCSAFNVINFDSGNLIQAGGVTDTQQRIALFIKVTGINATVALSNGTLPASPTGADLFVIELPSNLT